MRQTCGGMLLAKSFPDLMEGRSKAEPQCQTYVPQLKSSFFDLFWPKQSNIIDKLFFRCGRSSQTEKVICQLRQAAASLGILTRSKLTQLPTTWSHLQNKGSKQSQIKYTVSACVRAPSKLILCTQFALDLIRSCRLITCREKSQRTET